jgi:uncharacterized membrane protein YcaP (DUF421 family)
LPTAAHLLPNAHQWGVIFWPQITWVEKVARPFVVYLFLLLAFRISGKRELGQATLFDFLIILLISNVVQNAMIGQEDASVFGSFVGVATLLALSFFLNQVTARSRRARQVLEGSPTLLVHKGRILDRNMMTESVSRNDLLTALREQGIASLQEVRYAILELDGKISVIKNDASHPAAPQDACIPPEILAQTDEDGDTTVPPSVMRTERV